MLVTEWGSSSKFERLGKPIDCSSSSPASSTVSSTVSKACKDLWKESKKSTLFKGTALLELPHVDTPRTWKCQAIKQTRYCCCGIFLFFTLNVNNSLQTLQTATLLFFGWRLSFLNKHIIQFQVLYRINVSNDVWQARYLPLSTKCCLTNQTQMWKTTRGRVWSINWTSCCSCLLREGHNICEKKHPEAAMFQFFCVEVRLSSNL